MAHVQQTAAWRVSPSTATRCGRPGGGRQPYGYDRTLGLSSLFKLKVQEVLRDILAGDAGELHKLFLQGDLTVYVILSGVVLLQTQAINLQLLLKYIIKL